MTRESPARRTVPSAYVTGPAGRYLILRAFLRQAAFFLPLSFLHRASARVRRMQARIFFLLLSLRHFA